MKTIADELPIIEHGLNNESKYLYDLIVKYHKYFSTQDKKYRKVVRILKVIVLFFAMSSTIVLGLKTVLDVNVQLVTGLILSALITFLTAVLSYFNFEEYWMRNITIHIELNIIRDNFIFDDKAGKLDDARIEYYRNKLDDIQNNNIQYWNKAIKK